MADIIGVKFKSGGKVYYFAPLDEDYALGEGVVVETARGIECGEVALERTSIPDEKLVYQLKPVVRKATDEDMERMHENRKKEESAFGICEKRIEKHGLDMKLVSVEYAFDGSKILFCFTSDGRVDFRELVKDLAGIFRTRIELRQIGVRDEARMLGGLGICGRPFCCATFLTEFQPVSIKMAKEQGLSLNPVKISGTCGRLMCCLKYEQPAYDELVKITPRIGAVVRTPDGKGTVVDRNLVSGNLRVQLEGEGESVPRTYHRSVVSFYGSHAKHEPVQEEEPTDAELEELARLEDEGTKKPQSRQNGDQQSQNRQQSHNRQQGQQGQQGNRNNNHNRRNNHRGSGKGHGNRNNNQNRPQKNNDKPAPPSAD